MNFYREVRSYDIAQLIESRVRMPSGARLLSVNVRADDMGIELHALVDRDALVVERRIGVVHQFGGSSIDVQVWTHVASVYWPSISSTLHVFDGGEE